MKGCLGSTKGTSFWVHRCIEEVQELDSVSKNALNAWITS